MLKPPEPAHVPFEDRGLPYLLIALCCAGFCCLAFIAGKGSAMSTTQAIQMENDQLDKECFEQAQEVHRQAWKVNQLCSKFFEYALCTQNENQPNLDRAYRIIQSWNRKRLNR